MPVCRELFADADTPVSIYRKLANNRPGTFLLESAAQGIFDRYSFVGTRLFGVLTEKDGRALWQQAENSDLTEERLLPGGVSQLQPAAALTAVYDRWQTPAHPGLPPLASGFVGYLGWESVTEFENIIPRTADAQEVPRQYLGFVSDMVVIDHRQGTVVLVANVLCDGVDPAGTTAGSPDAPHTDAASPAAASTATASAADATAAADAEWDRAQARLDEMAAELAKPLAAPIHTFNSDSEANPRRFTTEAEFTEQVLEAKRRIVDGDIFQVVLSQRFDQECSADPLDVYRVLRHLNPSPYLYLLSCTDSAGEVFTVVGSSPEALVTVNEGSVLTHPIAGSRPRGENPAADQALEAELIADNKERSEHLMLVDLARNDLSRVCEPGTVAVSEFMIVERFSHIMHISSTVEGELRSECNPVEALKATFPAGTLSGAPKPWALRIINELEPVRRGVYGGVVGYFGLGGHADLAIAIRTATIKNGVATVQAGAGIVADSDPAAEAREVESKAAAPLRAVAIANSLSAPESNS